MKILDRYIATEFMIFFGAVIFGFVVLMTGNTIFLMSALIMNKRIPFFVVSQILILRIPAMFVLGFPVATIFAVMLTMGRLAKDSEIVAMRTGGLSFLRIIFPLVFMASVISIGSFYLNEIVVPNANHISQNYIRQFFLSEVMENAKANVFFKIPGGLVLYKKKFDTEKKDLRNVMVFETKEYGFPDISDVQHGAIKGDDLILEDGVKYEINKDGQIDQQYYFKTSTKDISREIRKLYGEQKKFQDQLKGLEASVTGIYVAFGKYGAAVQKTAGQLKQVGGILKGYAAAIGATGLGLDAIVKETMAYNKFKDKLPDPEPVLL